MLYDPKRDPLSLDALEYWASQQPARQHYGYRDYHQCFAAQYCAHIGVDYGVPAPLHMGAAAYGDFMTQLDSIGASLPHTFGAALKRVRWMKELVASV